MFFHSPTIMPALIFWVALYIYVCLISEIFREVFGALFASHTHIAWVICTTWTMHHRWGHSLGRLSKGNSFLFGILAGITESVSWASWGLSSCRIVNGMCVWGNPIFGIWWHESWQCLCQGCHFPKSHWEKHWGFGKTCKILHEVHPGQSDLA